MRSVTIETLILFLQISGNGVLEYPAFNWWIIFLIIFIISYHFHYFLSSCDLRGLVCTIVVGADGREKCFMSCINSLSQADIGLSQKVMRNAKTFYHNSTIGARLRDLYYICQTIHGNTKKQKYRNQCFPFQRSTTCSPKRWMQNMFSKPGHFFCPHPTPRSPFNPRSGKLGTYSY